jgi:hypothetical protein
MNNTTSIKIPKKYESKLELVERDSDGYWGYTIKGFYFEGMGGECHTAHEDTQHELLQMIRTIKSCDCKHCKE